jgi:hypothetical protein
MCFNYNNKTYEYEGGNNMWKMRLRICVIFYYQKLYKHIHTRQSKKQKKNKLEELEK